MVNRCKSGQSTYDLELSWQVELLHVAKTLGGDHVVGRCRVPFLLRLDRCGLNELVHFFY